MLTVPEAAELLSVRPATLYAWIHKRKPGVVYRRIGKKLIRFELEDVEKTKENLTRLIEL